MKMNRKSDYRFKNEPSEPGSQTMWFTNEPGSQTTGSKNEPEVRLSGSKNSAAAVRVNPVSCRAVLVK